MLPVYKTVKDQTVASVSASTIEPFKLRFEIPITQESGTPSHTSPKTFTGYYKANIKVSPVQSDPLATNYEVQFWPTPPERVLGYIEEGDYVYGAYAEIDKNGHGTLTQLHRFYIITGSWQYLDADNGIFYLDRTAFRRNFKTITDDEVPPILCTRFVACKYSELDQHDDAITYAPNNKGRLIVKCSAYANRESSFNNFMSNNSVRAVVERDKPLVRYFDAVPIMPLEGQNYVWSDIGNILLLEYASYECGDYINLIKQGNLQHIRVRFLFDNTIFEDEDFSADNITLSAYMNPEIDLTFGVAYMSEINMDFMRSEKTDQLKWQREFSVELGVENDDNETEWISVGIFSGNRPISTLNDVIEFTAYDRMQRFDRPASDFLKLLTFPCTLQDIYSKLCSFVGLEYVSGDEIPSIMARTFTVSFDTGDIGTLRELLAKIAEANGCYARMTNDGKVKLVWFANHTGDYELLRDDIFSIASSDLSQVSGQTWEQVSGYTWDDMQNFQYSELYDKSSPLLMQGITAIWSDPDVTIRQPEDTESGAKRSWNEIRFRTWGDIGAFTYNDVSDLGWKGNYCVIENNPFVWYDDEADIRDHLQKIVSRLVLFPMYHVARINAVGNWIVEPGDIIGLEFEDGTIANYPIFSRMLSWNGSCECDYESTGSLTR